MKAQLTLTVNEGKELIAIAIAQMPEVQSALKFGKILLKGGRTVSALAEILVVMPLRISGRITPLGTKFAYKTVKLKRAVISGVNESKEECKRGCPNCDNHVGCIYAGREKIKLLAGMLDNRNQYYNECLLYRYENVIVATC